MFKSPDGKFEESAKRTRLETDLVPGPKRPPPAEIVQKTFLGEFAAAPHIRRGRGRPTAQPESAPLEIEPSWGDCKRYDSTMKRSKYNDVVEVARWVFDSMKAFPDGAQKCTEKIPRAKPDAPYGFASYFTNGYLSFQDIKRAADRRLFEDIKIGYRRCETSRRETIENHAGRAAFKTWAIEQIRKDAGISTQQSLLAR